MKHLCGRFESQSFSWSVIQSVLDHSNLLICDSRHSPFLRNVLAQQAIEVFVAPALPACKGPSKVARALQLLINMNMPGKLFSIVIGQSLHTQDQWFEVIHYG